MSMRFLPLLLALAACSSAPVDPVDARTGSSDAGPVDAGPQPETITVDAAAGVEVVAPGSGLRFAFPEGAQGSLQVTPRTDVAPPSVGVQVVELAFDSAKPVSLVLERPSANHTVQLYARGGAPGAIEGGEPRATRWFVVPKRSDDGTRVTYDLPLPIPNAAAPDPTQSLYGTLILQADPREAPLRELVYSELARLPSLMPEALATQLQARRDALGLEIAFDDSGSSYSGFTWGPFSGTRPAPVLTLRRDATADVVAHEIGHYVTHLLAGDTLYRGIEDVAPDADHGVGEQQGRATITEDYAYFMEFLLGYNRPCNTVRSMFGAVDPQKKDVPGLEGFGCAMLAGVGSSGGLDWTGARGAGRLGLSDGDALGLFRSGAKDVPALLAAITALATSTDHLASLPPMLESIGWSYAAKGTVHEADGTAVENASVSMFTNDGRTLTPTTTDAAGAFQGKGFGPGSLRVLVRANGETSTADATIDPSKTTTTLVELGDLRLRDDIRTLDTGGSTWPQVICFGEFSTDWTFHARIAGSRDDRLVWTPPEVAMNESAIFRMKSTKDSAIDFELGVAEFPITSKTCPWVRGDGEPGWYSTNEVIEVQPFFTCERTDLCGAPAESGPVDLMEEALHWSGRGTQYTGGTVALRYRVRVRSTGFNPQGVVQNASESHTEYTLATVDLWWE